MIIQKSIKIPQILLTGANGVGKTTLLSSMLYECRLEPIKSLLSVVDRSCMEPEKPSLLNKQLELQDLLLNIKNIPFHFEYQSHPNMSITEYELDLSTPNHIERMELIFKEIPISYTTVSNILREIEKSDVLIVAIDTPSLMYPESAFAETYNDATKIFEILNSIIYSDSSLKKNLIFVPIKCEKWIHTGRIDSVINTIKQRYNCIFKIEQYTKLTVEIIPVATIGGVIFDEPEGNDHIGSLPCTNENTKELFRLVEFNKPAYCPNNCIKVLTAILRHILEIQNHEKNNSIFPQFLPQHIHSYIGTMNEMSVIRIINAVR